MYGVPTVPDGRDGVVISMTEIVNDFVAVPLGVPGKLSVTLTIKVLLPEAVGMPDITPPELRARPVGKVPLSSVHVYGV